jgi:hypothetical protein
MAVTQKSYVDNSSSVKAARKKLDAAKAALSDANKAKAGLPSSAGKELASQIETRISKAETDLDKALADVTEVETKAKNYFTKNEETITAKSKAKDKATGESNVASAEAQIARMKEAGFDTTALEAQVTKTKNKTVAAAEANEGSGSTALTVEQINKQLDILNKNPRQLIFGMDPQERINLARTLTAAGFITPELKGQFNDGLVSNYKAAISQAKSWNTLNKDLEGYTPVDLTGFLTYRTGLTKAAGGGGTGGLSNYIYSPTEAKSAITKVITSLLGREATDKEVASISKQLIAAQKANPGRTVKGITTGRLDADQFITDIIKSGKEFASKVQAKQDLTTQGIEAVARANGLNLRPNELKTYSDRVKNGEDIKTIENQLRAVASLGQPDAIKKLMEAGTDLETIYAPYKRTLATSLGLNPESITLDDPTLRMAIGPDKEMSLYDYKKAIRNDSRWKYSEEANDEVSEMINQVKRDFGFMG